MLVAASLALAALAVDPAPGGHYVLKGWLARSISERGLLRLIRRFLEAGMMDGGTASALERPAGRMGHALKQQEEARRFWMGDVEMELEARDVDAMVHRP